MKLSSARPRSTWQLLRATLSAWRSGQWIAINALYTTTFIQRLVLQALLSVENKAEINSLATAVDKSGNKLARDPRMIQVDQFNWLGLCNIGHRVHCSLPCHSEAMQRLCQVPHFTVWGSGGWPFQWIWSNSQPHCSFSRWVHRTAYTDSSYVYHSLT